jgi:hypothetical protein
MLKGARERMIEDGTRMLTLEYRKTVHVVSWPPWSGREYYALGHRWMSLHGGEGKRCSTRRPNILANIDHISEKLAAKTANFSGPTPSGIGPDGQIAPSRPAAAPQWPRSPAHRPSPSGRSPKPFSIRWGVLLRALVTLQAKTAGLECPVDPSVQPPHSPLLISGLSYRTAFKSEL